MRSTTKYWVRMEDVSTVKHHVLQHLPVFQFDKNNFAGDAQVRGRQRQRQAAAHRHTRSGRVARLHATGSALPTTPS